MLKHSFLWAARFNSKFIILCLGLAIALLTGFYWDGGEPASSHINGMEPRGAAESLDHENSAAAHNGDQIQDKRIYPDTDQVMAFVGYWDDGIQRIAYFWLGEYPIRRLREGDIILKDKILLSFDQNVAVVRTGQGDITYPLLSHEDIVSLNIVDASEARKNHLPAE